MNMNMQETVFFQADDQKVIYWQNINVCKMGNVYWAE